MRKKRLIVFISLMILLCSFSHGLSAENGMVPSIRDTVSSENQAFRFRNGIMWNMSPEQVDQLEQSSMEKYSSGDWSVMLTSEPVNVSRFTADLIFMFKDNTLQMITYEFQSDGSTLNYQYLTGALCSVYGQNKTAEPALIKGLMDKIYPGRFDIKLITNPFSWAHEDGTLVLQYYYSSDRYAILYANPDILKNHNGYETEGL